ncbi:ABC transporter permease [Tsuneonella flava]|uniref:ABC transporter permease n=1 Tax=Tsuneonella flava TaxID=2055955 RepID=A0ABX7KCD5_9SPHN|nr:ABC transporter permease [Tsuneonella flava]QSB45007.1 ABC transporter permease [Tsuneonella flava]
MTGQAAPAARLSLLRAAFVIARRDFLAILLSKAFFFFLLGPIILIAVSGGAGAIGAKAAKNAHPAQLAVAMPAEQAHAFAAAHDRIDPLVSVPAITLIDPAQASDPAALLQRNGENYGAVLTGSLTQPVLTGTEDQIRKWQGEVALLAATASGTDRQSFPRVITESTTTSGAAKKSARAGTATAALTLLFLLTMLLAGMVLSNLVEEKANKIIEVLAASIPMDAVFLGKLFAMLAVSFVGIAVWGGIGLAIMGAAGGLTASLPAPAVGWPLFVVLFLLYFAMAYLIIGSVFLAIGAMAPTVRDVQTLSMPATMLQLGVFFLATYASTDLGSPVELAAAVFPPSSPYAMISRAAQVPDLWPHLVALAWQAMWVIVFVRAGSAMFRLRVMKSGPQQSGKRRLFGKAAR